MGKLLWVFFLTLSFSRFFNYLKWHLVNCKNINKLENIPEKPENICADVYSFCKWFFSTICEIRPNFLPLLWIFSAFMRVVYREFEINDIAFTNLNPKMERGWKLCAYSNKVFLKIIVHTEQLKVIHPNFDRLPFEYIIVKIKNLTFIALYVL